MIFNESCLDTMRNNRVKDVSLIVTSPPYNVGVPYTEYDDSKPLQDYLDMLAQVWLECYDVLLPGGRIAINIGGTGRKPYIPLQSYVTQQLINIGYLMRGYIYWEKGASAGNSTAWGSWRSPSNPVLRDTGEFILVACKDRYDLVSPNKKNGSGIGSEEFMEFTKSMWEIPAVRNKDHPATFPEEIPRRLTLLYTYIGDTVYDPFCGVGTTVKVAEEFNRIGVGSEIDTTYVAMYK